VRRRTRYPAFVALGAVLFAGLCPCAFGAGRAATDVVAYATAPSRWRTEEWGRLAVGTASVVALGFLDEGVRATIRDRRTPTTRHIANIVRGGGDFFGWGGAAVATTWLGGLALGNEALEETGFEMAEAAVLSASVVAALKLSVGRSRPDEGRGAGTFHPLQGGLTGGRSSFPSQHTAFAFAAASVAAERHPGLGWVTYPLAGLVGLSRVHDDRHWLSDVAAGAGIGLATGLWVARRGTAGGEDDHAALTPWLGPDTAGLAWTRRF